MRMKRTLFSIVLLAAFAVQGLYAQATREEIFNDIAESPCSRSINRFGRGCP